MDGEKQCMSNRTSYKRDDFGKRTDTFPLQTPRKKAKRTLRKKIKRVRKCIKLKCHIVFNRIGGKMICQERAGTAGTGGME